MNMLKPTHLSIGDRIATISPCFGCAGDTETIWKYNLGKNRLEREFGLEVISAPNSLRGTEYLKANPKARAEDFMWAFSNKDIKAIIANVGGNDSIKIIPYINKQIITDNPKIFIGYSDVMFLHLLCYKANLSSFYGHNLLTTIAADFDKIDDYSKYWFKKVLFDNSKIGLIFPSEEWTCDAQSFTNASATRKYIKNNGYTLIQGTGIHHGKLFGGHTYLWDTENTSIELNNNDFDNTIMFIEDVVEYTTPKQFGDFFGWLGKKGFLQLLNGIIIGKLTTYEDTSEYLDEMLAVVNEKYGLYSLPILAGLNFGHTSPICILPYGAMAEINCEKKIFSILESGVE